MISVAEAFAHIKAHQKDFGVEEVPLLDCVGRILAAPIFADRDFPPFDRVTMDGIAISSQAFCAGQRIFKIENIQAAGHPQLSLSHENHCLEVMTGAVLPQGCDAVIPYEDCLITDGEATVQSDQIQPRQNIHEHGIDERAGELLLSKGVKMTSSKIGIAATVGLEMVPVWRLPRIAICSTGDELVAINVSPEPHQIRRSNSYMLAAALGIAGITATMYHLPDQPEEMKQQLETMLGAYDVLLFSGAVSKGRYDYLPAVLKDTGMDTIFHRVAQKPGKPLLFGAFKEGPIVFGFPGNPVSTLVCFQVFFQSWLSGSLQQPNNTNTARLAVDFTFKPALDYHLPVTIAIENGMQLATPCAGSNSGDMVSLARAEAIITLPAGQQEFKQGEVFPLTWL